jgi:hypothetical protein
MANARYAASVPRVMMKEGMRSAVTKTPLRSPKSRPRTREMMIARGTGIPTVSISPAVITAETPMMEPTDRSMTPQISPKAMPMETRPRVVMGRVKS